MGHLCSFGGDVRLMSRSIAPHGASPHDVRGQVLTCETRFRAPRGMVRAHDEFLFCGLGSVVLAYGAGSLLARLCLTLWQL